MTYELNLSGQTWNLSPPTRAEEILQNVKCLLLTTRGTVYGYRAFGVNLDMLDAPITAVQSRFAAQVAKLIATYEPRAKLKRIDWRASQALDGKLEPRIFIETGGNS